MKRFVVLSMMLVATVLGLSAVDAQGPIRNFVNNRRSTAPSGYCDTNGNCYDANGVLIPKAASAPTNPPPKAMPGQVAASLRGDAFCELVRLKVAAGLRKQGHSVADAHTLANSVSNDVIKGCAASVKIPDTVLGDGTIIQAIIAFFQSAAGQQLIAALVEMLIKLITGL